MDNMDEINSTQTSPMIPVSPVDNELPTMDHVYTCTLPDILPNDCVASTVEVVSSVVDEEAHNYCNIEAVDIDPGEPLKSNHHTGPIAEEYIKDKIKRQKSFSKRMKSFKNDARLLHYMCGAKVSLTVVSQSGRLTKVHYPAKEFRTVKSQEGEPCVKGNITKAITRKTSSGSPKKSPLINPPSSKKSIKCLPGKKTKTVEKKTTKTTLNRCGVCSRLYRGKSDLNFLKEVGKLKWSWLGCDRDGCDYWAHAICAGMKIPCMKKLPVMEYLCPAHK